jgi:hypothetical protein
MVNLYSLILMSWHDPNPTSEHELEPINLHALVFGDHQGYL